MWGLFSQQRSVKPVLSLNFKMVVKMVRDRAETRGANPTGTRRNSNVIITSCVHWEYDVGIRRCCFCRGSNEYIGTF